MLSCWVDNIKLNVSDVRNIRNRDGVRTKVNDWGYTDGIDYLDKVCHYESLNYERNNILYSNTATCDCLADCDNKIAIKNGSVCHYQV